MHCGYGPSALYGRASHAHARAIAYCSDINYSLVPPMQYPRCAVAASDGVVRMFDIAALPSSRCLQVGCLLQATVLSIQGKIKII